VVNPSGHKAGSLPRKKGHTMGHLGDELMELFDLDDEASTLIAGGADRAVARETIDRLSESMRMKVGLAKVGFSIERINENMEKQNGRIGVQEKRCDNIQGGETAHGCAHLDTLSERVSRWVVAQSLTMAILAAVGVAGIGLAMRAIFF